MTSASAMNSGFLLGSRSPSFLAIFSLLWTLRKLVQLTGEFATGSVAAGCPCSLGSGYKATVNCYGDILPEFVNHSSASLPPLRESAHRRRRLARSFRATPALP